MKTKDRIYERILEHRVAEGEADPEFKEPNVSNLVLHIIVPISNGFFSHDR